MEFSEINMMDCWCLRLEFLKYEIVSLIIPNDLFSLMDIGTVWSRYCLFDFNWESSLETLSPLSGNLPLSIELAFPSDSTPWLGLASSGGEMNALITCCGVVIPIKWPLVRSYSLLAYAHCIVKSLVQFYHFCRSSLCR